MSDEEFERFEITDYDLENEFNINRPRKRYTKHQQIYGIWADDSDNDDEELSSRKNRRNKIAGSKQKDYTAPVSFVAGGVQQAGKKEKNEDNDDSNQITDEEDDRPSFSRKGIEDLEKNTSSESEPEEAPRAGFGSKKKPAQSSTGSLASWEKHTKGIGAKLLLQMGYEPGKGLGKDLQGISRPVEAHVRKGRGAIGAYGPEKASSVPGQPARLAIDEDVKEEKEFKEKLNQWKKGSTDKKDRKKRYYYKSVEEILEKSKKGGPQFPDLYSKKLSNVTVIDMTGPEKRVLSGYHALGQAKIADEDLYESRPTKKKTNFALPELMHNLDLIVNMCEQEIIAVDRAERDANEKQKQLEHEKENLEKIIKLEQDHINILESALELVESLTNNENLTLDEAEKLFIRLQTDYAAEYKEFGLGDLAAGVIAPLINNELKNWKPLEEPTKHVNKIKKWQNILGMHQSEVRSVFDPYSSIIWSGVVPQLRICAADWNPKMHQRMAALLDTWAPLFPTWILDNVLEQLILPKLVTGVQEWDPLTDTIPIHSWILPWNGILGHKMEEFIFPTIREKLGNALTAWLPNDRSARAMLQPWREAFKSAEMEAFIVQHIIPKLQLVLNELVINPLQQDWELWNQVYEWNELISPLLMAQMLDKYFFPKWTQTLIIWLNQSPNFDQISQWYTGWKSLISEDIIAQPTIKEHFRRALEMMHRATQPTNIDGQPSVSIPQNIPPPPPIIEKPPALMDLQILPPPQLEFKELVSQKCAERGIIFAPMPGRREFGKQVYRIGKLFCYIDRSVLMVSDGTFTNWIPISLAVLMERAVSG
ncbi:septin-interacting protein 1 [Condylostylus longicornis]|uniref:septin-interacting protein 1 n=1 Tax=Condylostylus longicornis TaxID=2530218 RepID=UPI00244E37C5|nr:septin-interacting protein 1 [Condylostylus longicornis]